VPKPKSEYFSGNPKGGKPHRRCRQLYFYERMRRGEREDRAFKACF